MKSCRCHFIPKVRTLVEGVYLMTSHPDSLGGFGSREEALVSARRFIHYVEKKLPKSSGIKFEPVEPGYVICSAYCS